MTRNINSYSRINNLVSTTGQRSMKFSPTIPDDKLFELISRELDKGKTVALAIIIEKIGSGPRDVGAKMAVLPDGTSLSTLGGGPFEKRVIEKALEVIRTGKPCIVRFDFTGKGVNDAVDTGLICGGVLTVYIDVLKPSPNIFIVGAGRIGKPLADILGGILKYKVIILDPQQELVSKEIFPYARELFNGSPQDIADYIYSNARDNDIVLIVHGEINVDYPVLKKALQSRAKYIGLLGSRRKVVEFIKRLVKEGIDVERIKTKLYAPIGIDIGSETPEEIAISIASKVITYIRGLNKKEYKDLDIIRTDIMSNLINYKSNN